VALVIEGQSQELRAHSRYLIATLSVV